MSHYGLFDNFQDSILVISDDGSVHYGNMAASVLMDVSAKRLATGKPLANFISFDPNPFQSSDIQKVTEATQFEEISFTTSSGKQGYVQVSTQLQPDYFQIVPDQGRRFIVYLRDVSLEKTLHSKYRSELDKKEAVISDLQIAREKLEEYSRDLEKRVAERTAELSATNQMLKAILDSLGQGILVFDRAGQCLSLFSQVCTKILGQEPAGKPIAEVLGLDEKETHTFKNWCQAVFEEMLPFEDMLPLGPGRLNSKDQREIVLSYNAMRSLDGAIQNIVLVATDRTREVEAIREASRSAAPG